MFHPLRKKRFEIGVSGVTKDFIRGTSLSLRYVGCPGDWDPQAYNLRLKYTLIKSFSVTIRKYLIIYLLIIIFIITNINYCAQ